MNTKLVLAAMALLLSACATTHGDREYEETRAALIATNDADSLAAAAMMSAFQPTQPATRLELFEKATAAAPERADLAWFVLQQCVQVESCDPKPYAEKLHALDPGNGAAWYGLVTRAAKAGNADAVQEYMREIGKANRFDIYWSSSVVHMTNALLKTRKVEAFESFVMATGLLTTVAVPAYNSLANACRGDVLQRAEVLTNCRKVATVMRGGDAYTTEMIGDAIAKNVWPEGAAEYQEVVEDQRVARYRISVNAELDPRGRRDDQYFKQYVALSTKHSREQDIDLERIVAAGRDPNPPEGWTESKPVRR